MKGKNIEGKERGGVEGRDRKRERERERERERDRGGWEEWSRMR